VSAEVAPVERTGDEGGGHPSRRTAIEFYISLTAVVFGTVGLLARVWVLEVLALLVACVALGMVLVRCLPPDDR